MSRTLLSGRAGAACRDVEIVMRFSGMAGVSMATSGRGGMGACQWRPRGMAAPGAGPGGRVTGPWVEALRFKTADLSAVFGHARNAGTEIPIFFMMHIASSEGIHLGFSQSTHSMTLE